MKILHVLQGDVGGSVEFVNMLMPKLKAKGYVNVAVCPKTSMLREKAIAQGVEYIELDMCREISFIKDACSFLKLLKIIKTQKPDIVHLHSTKAGAVGRPAAWLRRIPSVYTPHGWSFIMSVSDKKRGFYACVERILSHITTKITCISQNELKVAVERGIKQDKLLTIDNGIEISKYETKENVAILKNRLGLPKGKIIIGMVGRLTEAKNPLTICVCFKKTYREHLLRFSWRW